MRNRFLRSATALLFAALAGTAVIAPAQTIAQDATPSPIASLPEGALGEQMHWLVDYINAPEEEAANVDLTTKFAPSVLAALPAADLQAILSQFRAAYAPVTVDTATMAVTDNVPPTSASFSLIGADGTQVPTTLTIDPASGLINGLWFATPIAPVTTSVATETATATEEVTEVASPEAEMTEASSPIAVASDFPSGPLGEQAAWTWSLLNGSTPITEQDIETHLSPETLTKLPAAQAAAAIEQVMQQLGPFTLIPDSTIVTGNEPSTNLSYLIAGKDGGQLRVSIAIDPASGLLTQMLISPAIAQGTPVALPIPSGLTDTDLSFTSGGDTIYGSFLAPDGLAASDSVPAALIISGSGPTDRNGNSGGLSMNTNLNLATTLAAAGIPSLRYDKLGSGKTGLGTHADGSGIDFELFLQEARDAAKFLSEQPGVDPSKLILVGHSEGALFALVLADELSKAGTPPAGLILAAPLSVRYLDILQTQIEAQLSKAVAAQQMTDTDAAAISTELTDAIDSIRTTGTLAKPVTSPALTTIFSPANIPFLAQADKLDPAEIAAGLPTDLPVLVLLGYKDAQVTADEVRELFYGFRDAGNDSITLASLPNADHTLRIIEGEANPTVDYANPNLQFSPDAIAAIDAFLEKYGLSAAS